MSHDSRFSNSSLSPKVNFARVFPSAAAQRKLLKPTNAAELHSCCACMRDYCVLYLPVLQERVGFRQSSWSLRVVFIHGLNQAPLIVWTHLHTHRNVIELKRDFNGWLMCYYLKYICQYKHIVLVLKSDSCLKSLWITTCTHSHDHLNTTEFCTVHSLNTIANWLLKLD